MLKNSVALIATSTLLAFSTTDCLATQVVADQTAARVAESVPGIQELAVASDSAGAPTIAWVQKRPSSRSSVPPAEISALTSATLRDDAWQPLGRISVPTYKEVRSIGIVSPFNDRPRAAWQEKFGRHEVVYGAFLTADGNWLARQLSNRVSDGVEPQIASADGSGMIAWIEDDSISTVRWSAETEWTAGERIPNSNHAAALRIVHLDGRPFVVWIRREVDRDCLRSAQHGSDEGWTAPIEIGCSEVGSRIERLQLSAREGQAVAGWIESADGSVATARLSTHSDAGWDAPLRVSDPELVSGEIVTAFDPRNRPVILTTEGTKQTKHLYARFLEPDGSVGESEDLTPGPVNAAELQSISSAQQATVAWALERGRQRVVQTRTLTGDRWSATASLSAPAGTAACPQLTLGPDGVVVAWTEHSGNGASVWTKQIRLLADEPTVTAPEPAPAAPTPPTLQPSRSSDTRTGGSCQPQPAATQPQPKETESVLPIPAPTPTPAPVAPAAPAIPAQPAPAAKKGPTKASGALSSHWFIRKSRSTAISLGLTRLIKGSKVSVSCQGRGCAFRTKEAVATNRSLNLLPLFSRRRQRALRSWHTLRSGTKLEIVVSIPGLLPKKFTLVVRRGRQPLIRSEWLAG